ncbi:hypothetical protein pVco14_015 [Vibrio phage pVco-14]|nr:hypothetical protein pVco14_015 [Vibrio phage pVco-14]
MKKLIEVLGQLDPTKDEHWTQDGVARLDVVSELVGSQVTRAQIQEVAPKFSRANPNVVTAKVDPFAQVSEEDKPEMLGTGSASVEGGGDETETKAPQENHAGPVELTAEQEIETEYKNAKTALEAAQRRMQRATDRMDDLIRARESNQQNVTFTDNVQAYLKSQREELHRDHIAKERLKTLMKGLENDL